MPATGKGHGDQQSRSRDGLDKRTEEKLAILKLYFYSNKMFPAFQYLKGEQLFTRLDSDRTKGVLN